QVRSRRDLRQVRPEQAHDFITAVGTVGLVDEIRQQSARLLISKPLDGFVVERYKWWPEEEQLECGHRCKLRLATRPRLIICQADKPSSSEVKAVSKSFLLRFSYADFLY